MSIFDTLDKIYHHASCQYCNKLLNQATLIGKCSHNFCYQCCRAIVRTSKQCPICQTPVPKFKYIPNYVVDKIVCEVKILKEQLSKLGIISESFADTLTQKEKSYSQVEETDDENDDLVQSKLNINQETPEENPNILFASPQISELQA